MIYRQTESLLVLGERWLLLYKHGSQNEMESERMIVSAFYALNGGDIGIHSIREITRGKCRETIIKDWEYEDSFKFDKSDKNNFTHEIIIIELILLEKRTKNRYSFCGCTCFYAFPISKSLLRPKGNLQSVPAHAL